MSLCEAMAHVLDNLIWMGKKKAKPYLADHYQCLSPYSAHRTGLNIDIELLNTEWPRVSLASSKSGAFSGILLNISQDIDSKVCLF